MKNADSPKSGRSIRSPVTTEIARSRSEVESSGGTARRDSPSSETESGEEGESGERIELIRTLISPFQNTRYLVDELSSCEEYGTLTEARSDPALWIVISGVGLVAGIELTGLLVVLTPFSLPEVCWVVLNAYPFIGLVSVILLLQPFVALWVASAVRIRHRGILRVCFHAIEAWLDRRDRTIEDYHD